MTASVIDSPTLDISAINSVLKNRYVKKKLNTIAFLDRPFFARVAKNEKGGGANMTIGIRNQLPATRSTRFSNSQAIATNAGGPSTYNSWVMPWYSDYATANITGAAIDQASGDENALIDVVTAETDGAFDQLANACAIALYKNGGGSRGSIGSQPVNGVVYLASGPTIALANPDDAIYWGLNMPVMVSADDGTGGAGTTTGGGGNNIGFIVAIDYDLGLLTVSSSLGGGNTNWSTIFNGVGAGYFLFAGGGGASSAGSDYNNYFAGIPGWLPITAPGASDSFYSQNRSKDPTKLAGVRVIGNGSQYEETIIEALKRTNRLGGKPEELYVTPTDWSGVEKSQQGRTIYNRVESFDDPEIGFRTLEFTGPKNKVQVISDPYGTTGHGYLLQMDTWEFFSMGGVPRIIDEDSIKLLRIYNADAYEMRLVYRGVLGCYTPGYNAHILF